MRAAAHSYMPTARAPVQLIQLLQVGCVLLLQRLQHPAPLGR